MNLGLREALKQSEAETNKYKSLYRHYKDLYEGKKAKPFKRNRNELLKF